MSIVAPATARIRKVVFIVSVISALQSDLDVSVNRLCNTYCKGKEITMDQIAWLLLLYSLPTNRNTERVAVWRRLKRTGAVQLTTSTYLLPDQPALYEQFQWLAKQIRDSGGDATLVRAQEIE